MLVKENEEGRKWYPTRVKSLREFLSKVIEANKGYDHVVALRQNIAYNIQHLQFIDRTLSDIKLSSVLKTQNIKTFVIVGCSIVESLLTYLLIKSGNYRTTKWEKVGKFSSQKTINGSLLKVVTIIEKEIDTPEKSKMKFGAMCQSAESNEILGANHEIYEKLNYLRQLRNKVHLQAINEPQDTDWNKFDNRHLSDMSMVLYEIFTSELFDPTEDEKEYFDFLLKYLSG